MSFNYQHIAEVCNLFDIGTLSQKRRKKNSRYYVDLVDFPKKGSMKFSLVSKEDFDCSEFRFSCSQKLLTNKSAIIDLFTTLGYVETYIGDKGEQYFSFKVTELTTTRLKELKNL